VQRFAEVAAGIAQLPPKTPVLDAASATIIVDGDIESFDT
jgi:hypothetical protein